MDELTWVSDLRPDVPPPSAQVVQSARSELMATIVTETMPTGTTRDRRRKLLVRGALVSLCVVATAAAGWAVIPRGGNLSSPPFSGDSWELTVGEESNGNGTFKVCRSFTPVGEDLQMNNSLGGAACETSPANAPKDDVITDVVRAFTTKTGTVVLVDLTKYPVSTVTIETDAGMSQDISPFAMPESREQFVAVEVVAEVRTIVVTAYDDAGVQLDRYEVSLG